jgi:hypothetical protein
MSLLAAVRLRTFSNKSAFEDVSLSTFYVSMVFKDVSSAFKDVSPLTLDLSPLLDNLSLQMSLACPFIFPSNSCQSDSIALLGGAVVSGSELVSVQHPIPGGFKGAVCE